MIKWFDRSDCVPQHPDRVVLCYCPDWCDSGYQVANYDGKEFTYHEQPNDMFDNHVESWCLILERF